MTPHDQPSPPKSSGSMRTFLVFAAIACIVIYPICYGLESWECFHIKPDDYKLRKLSYTQRLQSIFQGQLDKLQAVRPMALVDVYSQTVLNNNCDWFFWCQAIPPPPPAPHETPAEALHRTAESMAHPAPAPSLFTGFTVLGFPIPIPKWHTIAGTPHGLLCMAGAIFDAGPWAIALFLACTVIWVVLFRYLLREVKLPHIIYIFGILAPYWIALMVEAIQGIAQGLFDSLGFPAGLAAFVVTYANAIGVLVGIRHILRTPAELVEQLEKL